MGHQAQITVEILHQSRAIFDPIAIVAVQGAVNVSNFGPVDMTADDAVVTPTSSLRGQRLLKGRDERDRILDLVF